MYNCLFILLTVSFGVCHCRGHHVAWFSYHMVASENDRLVPLVWCVRSTGFVSVLCLVSFPFGPCLCVDFGFGVLRVDGMGVLFTFFCQDMVLAVFEVRLPVTFVPGGYGLASFWATSHPSATWGIH